MHWLDDHHGGWRLMDGGWYLAQVVHHLDGWRGFLNRTGEEVPGAPHATLEEAQAAVVLAVGRCHELGPEAKIPVHRQE